MKDDDWIHDSNPLVGKLLKLKYRINGTLTTEAVDDKTYVMTLINDIRNNIETFTKLDKSDFIKCNAMWKQYEG
jgi:hypothetical protein|tara:strand:+ start:222 stop:443 length:222 start_codon:yes stop_codon:yes gene_type:complete